MRSIICDGVTPGGVCFHGNGPSRVSPVFLRPL